MEHLYLLQGSRITVEEVGDDKETFLDIVRPSANMNSAVVAAHTKQCKPKPDQNSA